MLVLMAVVGTLAFEFQVSIPLIAERSLAGGAGTFTLLYSSLSAGAVVGGLIMARRRSVDARFLIRSALWMAAWMGLLALAPNVAAALPAAVLVGLTSVLLIAGSNAFVQTAADPAMRGRALALVSVIFLGSTPIGGPIVGAVAEQFGARFGVAIGAIATAAAAVWALSRTRGAETTRTLEPARAHPAP
jgi:MFS family permease